MTAIIALLPQLIALIPSVTTGVSSLIKFISEIRTAAKQTGAWPPELEAQFTDALIAVSQSDAWKTDAEVKA